MTNENQLVYAGFWLRVWAAIIDSFLFLIIVMPLMYAIYGENYFFDEALIKGPMDFLLTWVLPYFAVILFWVYRQATPGKMAIQATIVDAQTGEKPSIGQCVGRCFAYIPATICLGIGIVWVAVDRRKQGWHDKLAGTVVVRKRPKNPHLASFGDKKDDNKKDENKEEQP